MTNITEQDLFDILSHSIRRIIIRALTHYQYLSYSDLQELIPKSPGVIYHHIERLRKKGFIRQRSKKEYELTTSGSQLVSYMNRYKEEELSSIFSHSSIYKLFLKLPLSRFVQDNPSRWLIEAGILLLIISVVQIDFPILIIGPFLIPSIEPFLIRMLIQVIIYILMYLLQEICIRLIFVRNKPSHESFQLLSGLISLPLLSSIFGFFLWFTSLFTDIVPVWLFWLLTIVLNGCYVYLLIHLLTTIKKITLEQSIIIVLLLNYFFLISMFIFS